MKHAKSLSPVTSACYNIQGINTISRASFFVMNFAEQKTGLHLLHQLQYLQKTHYFLSIRIQRLQQMLNISNLQSNKDLIQNKYVKKKPLKSIRQKSSFPMSSYLELRHSCSKFAICMVKQVPNKIISTF
jgi:hypothetical protein